MGEEALEFLNRDFGTSLRINDTWQNNVGAMISEQEQIRRHVKELRDRHRTDQDTIDRLRRSNTTLEERLKNTIQEKDALMTNITNAESHLRDLGADFNRVSKERDAVVAEVREQNSHLERLEHVTGEREAEIKRLRDELRIATDTAKSVEAQLSRERDEWHNKCHELEQSARVRMEAQKRDMEQRQKSELAATSKQYADAHRKMKADFEEGLRVAAQQVEELTTQRDKWVAKAQKLHDEMEDYEADIRHKYQQMLAKNFFSVNAELEKPSDGLKRPNTPPRPISYAKHLLLETKNPDGSSLRTGSSTASDGENSPPPIRAKLRRYSIGAGSRASTLVPPSKAAPGAGQKLQRPSTSAELHAVSQFRRAAPKK